ncbi:MAG: Dockerin type domain, partial [Gemmatimonadota bacterium]
MRCRLLTVAAVCTPLALAGQQATPPMSAQQVLDLPGAVRFEAVERYQPTVQGSGPIELRLGSLRTLRVVPTDQVVIPIVIDPTTAPGTAVAALSAAISWNPQRFSLDSIVPGTFGSVQINTAGAASGALALSVFATEGATQPTTVGTLYLRAGASPGGTTVSLLPTQLGDTGGASLLRQALTRPTAACVAPPGNWGDANDDGQVNIIDAQQIARRSIALPVLRPAVLTAQGDVNADSVVDIIDAQQVARASIGLTAATRIGTPVFTIPPVFEILLGSVTEPLGVGEAAPLVASPRASDGLALDGCVPISWSSTSPTVAGVDSTGILRGLDLGSATITASAGGVSATTTITTIDRASVVTGFTVVDGPEIATYPNVQTGQPVRIRVTNEFGAGIPNIPVTVAPSGGTALIGPV